MERFVMSRKNHPYDSERVTPIEEIPPKFRLTAPLPGGNFQILDTRLCYNFNGKEFVECGSVWSHAKQNGFKSPEDNNQSQ